MTNLNATVNADEIALDDLFAEIDGLDAIAPAEPVALAVEPETSADDDLLDALLAEPMAVEAVAVEEAPVVVAEPEPVKAEEVPTSEIDELDGLFDENDLDLDALTLEEAPVVAEPEPKKAKPKKAEAKKEAEPKKEKPAAKEKSPTTYRTTYYNASKSKVLLDRLGGDKSDIVLEFADAELSDEELRLKQNSFLTLLNNQPTVNSDGQTVQKKVAEKVVILFTMFKQKKSWNEVMYRTFKLLLTDGYLDTKKGGNLYNNLLAKPYSPGTANAQMGQMVQMLPLLKVCTKDGSRLVPNEDSTILARLKSEYFGDLKVSTDAE